MNYLLIKSDNEVLCKRVKNFLSTDHAQIHFDIVKGEKKNFCVRACDIDRLDPAFFLMLGYTLGYYVRMCRE